MKPERHWSPAALVTHPVTDAANRFDQFALLAQFVPKPADVSVQCPGCCLAVVTPDLIHQKLACQDIPVSAHEFVQQIELFGSQNDRRVADKHLPALGEKLNFSGLQCFRPAFTDPPENRLNAQHEFAGAERLHNVVVCAKLKSDNT